MLDVSTPFSVEDSPEPEDTVPAGLLRQFAEKCRRCDGQGEGMVRVSENDWVAGTCSTCRGLGWSALPREPRMGPVWDRITHLLERYEQSYHISMTDVVDVLGDALEAHEAPRHAAMSPSPEALAEWVADGGGVEFLSSTEMWVPTAKITAEDFREGIEGQGFIYRFAGPSVVPPEVRP